MLAPAATFVSQGIAHAVVDQNGEDGVLNLPANNGQFSQSVVDGDQISLFDTELYKSAPDASVSDNADFDIFDLLVNSAA